MRENLPFGIQAIAIFQVVSALIALAGTDFTVLERELDRNILSSDFRFVLIALILAVVRPMTALGLWRLRHWGWTTAMVMTGLFLITDLLQYFTDRPDNHFALLYASMLVNVIIVFYLNQRNIRDIFTKSQEGSA